MSFGSKLSTFETILLLALSYTSLWIFSSFQNTFLIIDVLFIECHAYSLNYSSLGVNLESCDLINLDINKANLKTANLRNSNLTNTKINNSNISYAKFADSDLSNTVILNSKFISSEFNYANYLWDGERDEFMKPYTKITLPTPKNKR